MKKLITIYAAFLLINQNANSQSGWFQLNSGVTDDLYSVYFINTTTGFTAGGDKILKTTNGGTNWNIQVIANVQLRKILFLNSNIGYSVGSFGAVVKTTNGGNSWDHSDAGLQGDLYSVVFQDSLNGFVGGYLDGGFIRRTTNGGINWSYAFIGGVIPYDIYFINQMTGFASYAPGFLNKTSNGGNTWFQIPTGTPSSVYSLQFVNDLTGYAAGSAVIKTTNGGINWMVQMSGNTYPYFYSVYFINSNTGYLAGALNSTNNFIMSSSNGGINWVNQYSTPGLLLSVFFADNNTGYCVGFNGLILKTVTGGINKIQSISNEIPNKFSLSQNFPNPFNPNSKIKFQISKSSNVKLVVFDILGKEVQILVNEKLSPGTYEVNFDGSHMPSGVFYYRLDAGDYTETRKMVLIK